MDPEADMDERTMFLRIGDQIQIVMERSFEQAPSRLWSWLTGLAELPLWLAPGEIDPRPGGVARLDFGASGVVVDSLVTAVEPGRLLEYAWSGPNEPPRPLRWELFRLGRGCRLRLTLRQPAAEDAARAAAGFEAHLEMLAAALEGVPIKFPFEAFKAARDAYRIDLEAA
jgi:uncharacterized protein YndB with AHSA1/START domain